MVNLSELENDALVEIFNIGVGHAAAAMSEIVNEEVTIDATYKGNLAKWINHSCGPNCEAVEEDGRIFIESVKPIAPGEEITYDYRFILEERHTPANKRRFQCICGSKECRGTMLAQKR